MRILIIDNTVEPAYWGSEDLRRFARLCPGATIHVRRAPSEDLPAGPEGFDRIIASGSLTSAMEDAPWVDRLLEFIRRAIDARKPFLGVCYGHQALARAIGGKPSVRRAPEGEFGWTKIELLADSALTRGLPREFHSFSSHFDEVGELPRGMRRLARSEGCEVQAFELEGAPAYGIQFHPEKTVEEGEKIFEERRKKGTPKRLINPGKGPKLYDAESSERIFRNFFAL